MVVECIQMINTYSQYHIKIGGTYYVIGVNISTSNSIVSYRIINDDGSSGLFDSREFKIINNDIPSSWVATIRGSLLTIEPKSWTREGFWEDFYNDVPQAIEMFKKELSDMKL